MMKARLTSFWKDRSLREQRLIMVLALVLAVVVFVFLLWLPASRNVAQLESQLISLRSDRAQMQSMVRELEGSNRSGNSTVPAAADLADSLKQSLSQAGITPRRLELGAAGQWQLEVADVPFSTLADWLSRVRSDWKVTLLDGTFDRTATPGNVRAKLTLQGEGH
jgi:type II secretory pathway component PulM